MAWIYILPIFLLTDTLLYTKYWKQFARRYYFVNYGIGTGWMMAYKLRKLK